MNRVFFLFLLMLSTIAALAQRNYENIDYKNYQKALEILDLLNDANYEQIDSLNYNLAGKYHHLGHYPTPRQRRAYNVFEQVKWTRNNALLKSTLVEGKDTLVRKETISNNEIMILDYGEEKPQSNASDKEIYTPFYSPVSVYNDILKHKQSIRYIGFDESANCETIVYSSPFAQQVTVCINRETQRIESAQILKYEDIEGDYYLQFFYSDYIPVGEFELPSEILIKEWEEVKFELTYDYKNITKRSLVDTLHFTIETIAKNLYKVSYPTERHYSYIVDFGDYIGIIEAPKNETYMQHLTLFIEQNFSNKPIKYCFLTHHHPDHAGGFPFFYKNGAIVITTELSSVYQQQLLAKKHSLNNEKISYIQNGTFDIVRKDEVKDYSNENIKMKAFEFSNNGHTTEFLLYYFPESNILIVGDLYYIKESEVRASVRAARLLEFIDKNHLKVENLYTTWMPSSARIATIEDVKISSKAYNCISSN